MICFQPTKVVKVVDVTVLMRSHHVPKGCPFSNDITINFPKTPSRLLLFPAGLEEGNSHAGDGGKDCG